MESTTKKVKANAPGNTTKRLLKDEELKQVGGGIPTPDRMFYLRLRQEYEFISRRRDHHQP